jgi:hypothetical protein
MWAPISRCSSALVGSLSRPGIEVEAAPAPWPPDHPLLQHNYLGWGLEVGQYDVPRVAQGTILRRTGGAASREVGSAGVP